MLVARPENNALEPLLLDGPSRGVGDADASLLLAGTPRYSWDTYFESIAPGCTSSPCEERIRLEAEAGIRSNPRVRCGCSARPVEQLELAIEPHDRGEVFAVARDDGEAVYGAGGCDQDVAHRATRAFG